VDLFSVAVDHDRPIGPRAHFVRLGEGASMFGALATPPGVGRRLMAVGSNGTTIVAADAAAVAARATTEGLSPLVDELTEEWIDALCAGIAADGLVPKQCVDLPIGADVALGPTTAARPAPGICWIKHLEGRSMLLGRDGLEVNGHDFVPLSRRLWLQPLEPSRAMLLTTPSLPHDGDRWRGLARLHALALQSTALADAQTAISDSSRIRRKAANQQRAMSQACARLAATMQVDRAVTDRTDHEVAASDSRSAHLAACRLVGAALGIDVKDPAVHQGAPVARDQYSAILRASRLRGRKVALRDGWWRADGGPMLAWIADDKRPVALLPAHRGYQLHDPTRRTVQRVTAEVSAQLSPFAQALYRPFPATTIGVRQLVRFGFRGCSRDVTMLAAMGVAGAVLSMLPAIVTGLLFDSIIPGAQRERLIQIALVLIACAFAVAACNLQRGIAFLRIQGRMANELQSAVWDRLLSLPLSFFRPYTAGNLAVRAGAIDNIRQVVSGATVTALMGGIFSLGNFGLMFYYSSTMAWWATLMIAIAVTVTSAACYLQIDLQRGVLSAQAKTSGLVLQLLSNVGKLRVAGADRPAFALWGRGFSDQRALQFKARTIGNWVTAFNSSFPLVAYLFIFWAAQPAPGQVASLGTGDFLAFLTAFAACLTAVLSTCTAIAATLSVIPWYEQAKPILDAIPEVDAEKADPGVLTGDIEIQHAVFRYRSDGPLVLRDLTVQIKAGEFVAFVGPSGSGKSTVLRLLLGFEQLESGSIYFDGQELGGLDIHAARRQIGVVLQSGRLMSGDIFTNIVGSGAATREEAWEAARMAGFEDDIKQMPMGMHTVISEGGGTLSGGQRQRLMIARAIVNRPRILLFDEATSALDNRTQAIVSASLERLQATRIVVAHRLSTIVNADRICVIERGTIVESGNHSELMARNGLYAELAKRQIS
jgi:ATP-binding cassette subfamily C protein